MQIYRYNTIKANTQIQYNLAKVQGCAQYQFPAQYQVPSIKTLQCRVKAPIISRPIKINTIQLMQIDRDNTIQLK